MARDYYHEQVKRALQKEGWKVTHDPFKMNVDDVDHEIDLGAERLIAAEKGDEKIAVEIKSFVGKSIVNEFHKATGQFNDYFVALEVFDPERTLYLAVPEKIFNSFFQKPVIQRSLKRIGAKIIVYQPFSETIESWIE